MKNLLKLSTKGEIILIALIMAVALGVRLYEIDRPIADWHSWRQADTAAVARNFIKEGFNPFIPKYDDMSTQANGLDNPERLRFVEFPVQNTIIAAVWMVTGINETYARLVTVAFTLGSTLLLYLFVRGFSQKTIALLSAFIFATIPYNVFYSSTILPAPIMIFWLLAFYLTFKKWLSNDKNLIWALAAVIFANLAVLTWPVALFFFLPPVYLVFQKYGLSAFKNIKLWAFALISVAPFIAWRLWMNQFPEGIPNLLFLINENNIRFKGAFFRWIIVERLGNLILTVGGFTLLILGLIKKPQKEKLFYLTWLVSAAAYVAVFASGNVRHDYYQVPLIPILSIYMAIGLKSLFTSKSGDLNKILAPIAAVALLLSMYAFGFFEIRGYYWINSPQIVEAGKAVDRLIPKDATIIAPYNGDAAFLYQTNRHGYPIVDRPLEEFIEQGTIHLVSVDVKDAGIQNLARHCNVIEQTPSYLIVEMFTECIGR